LTIDFRPSGSFYSGQKNALYLMTLTNSGASPISNLTMSDVAGTAVTLNAISGPNGYCYPAFYTCTIALNLAPGQVMQFGVAVDVATTSSGAVTKQLQLDTPYHSTAGVISATATLSAAPVTLPMLVAPSPIQLWAAQGQVNSTSTIPVMERNGPTASITATAMPSWLSTSPLTSVGLGQTFTVNAAAASFTPGNYSGSVNFAAPGYQGVTSQVALHVGAQADTWTPPAGSPFSDPSVPSAVTPLQVFSGDFNGDGKPDILAIYQGKTTSDPSAATVLLGDGHGNFTTSGKLLSLNEIPYNVAVADFNGDGKLDLLVYGSRILGSGPNMTVGVVHIYLGDGAGGFNSAGSHRTIPDIAQANPAVSDLNGDGFPDVVVSLYGRAITFFGDGKGGFASAYDFELPQNTYAVVIGDLNGDGVLDLVVGPTGFGSVGNSYLGIGNGVFGPAQVLTQSPVLTLTKGSYLADMNGDGKLDLVVLTGSPRVYPGNGDGTFGNQILFPAGVGSPQVLIGDFNGDGKPDLAFARNDGPFTGVDLYLGDGHFGFTQAVGSPFKTVASPVGLVVGDWNSDGKTDFATLDSTGISVGLGSLVPVITNSYLTVSYPGGPLYVSSAPTGVGMTLSPAVSLFNTNYVGLAVRGMVQLLDGQTVLATIPANTTYTTPPLSEGNHAFTANYLGDSSTQPSNSRP
jgi:hypothetical protein